MGFEKRFVDIFEMITKDNIPRCCREGIQRKKLEYLKKQQLPPESDEGSIERKLHIVYSLAGWLIFYGKNRHGYEANF